MKRQITRLLIQTVVLLTITLNAFSQAPATGLIKVIISPDHKDWVYKVNEEAKFSVQILKYGNLVENATVDYYAGADLKTLVFKKGVVLKDGKLEITGTLKTPGFYRVGVSVMVDGKKYDGLATAAFDPDKCLPDVKEPADFDSFWTNALVQARKISLDPILTLVPERCTSTVNVYHISYQNDRPGSKIYGMLAIPKKAGKYPALIKLPGGGVYKYGGDARTASYGIITLEIGIHGIPVNLDAQVYADLSAGALSNYFNIRMNDKDQFYFKRVFIGAVKAIDFIYTLPEFNGKDLAVTGNSQGGLLSLVTAALDKRVKCLAAGAPAFCDMGRFMTQSMVVGGQGKVRSAEFETLSYYDGVNFAKRITVPTFFTWGYNDMAVPPATMHGTYNIITAPKELHIYQDSGHWTIPEQVDVMNAWLGKKLMGL